MSEPRESRTRSGRILRSINNDQRGEEVGRYAGWGGEEDTAARPARDRLGPGMLPRKASLFGLLWIPAIIALITVEDWMHVPQLIGWLSVFVMGAAFIAIWWWISRKPA